MSSPRAWGPGLDARRDRSPGVVFTIEEEGRHARLAEHGPRIEVHLLDPEAPSLVIMEPESDRR